MKFRIHVTDEQAAQLQFEVLSADFHTYITRYLLAWCETNIEDATTIIMRKNRLINLSRNISGGKIYLLESDDWGNFQSAEYAWHDSHFFLILRELTTIEFIELTFDLINLGHIPLGFIDAALKKEGASFSFYKERGDLKLQVYSIEEIEESSVGSEHVNIRTLVARMETAYDTNDFANVLHASASIFETMAKDIIGVSTVQDQTLGGFFEKYRKESNLPTQILDFILETYNKRNVTPLSGHGSISVPDIKQEEAIMLIEMTKAFVRIEYRSQREI